MQVLLHTDKNIDGGVRTAEYLETLAQGELHRFGEHITRVEAHLADANSHAKANKDDIHCTLEAHVKGLQPVVVKDHAGSAHQAIHGAMEKLKRAVGTADDMVMNVTNEAGRTFYRARFTGFTNADAQAACKSLKGEGFKCVTFSTATASAN